MDDKKKALAIAIIAKMKNPEDKSNESQESEKDDGLSEHAMIMKDLSDSLKDGDHEGAAEALKAFMSSVNKPEESEDEDE